MNKIKTIVGIGIVSLASFGMYEFGKCQGIDQERERIVEVLESKVKKDLRLAGENYYSQRHGEERESEFDHFGRTLYAKSIMKGNTIKLPSNLHSAVTNDKNDARTLYHMAEAHARTEVLREILSGEEQFPGYLVSEMGLR